MKTKPIDPEKAVIKGSKLLDRKFPKWWTKIKVTKLKMDTNENCVLGQLYKSPYQGLAVIGLIKPEDVSWFNDHNDSVPKPELEQVILKHGFMLDVESSDRVAEYNRLWKEAVQQRKKEEKSHE